jgi:hypothetical protein
VVVGVTTVFGDADFQRPRILQGKPVRLLAGANPLSTRSRSHRMHPTPAPS